MVAYEIALEADVRINYLFAVPIFIIRLNYKIIKIKFKRFKNIEVLKEYFNN